MRHRGGPGNRGGRPHRPGGNHGLVPQVVDAVGDRVPVVAAGASSTVAGWPPPSALGADGVWVGTRFIATPEARAVPGYKDTLLATGRTAPRLPGLTPARRVGWCVTATPRASRNPVAWPSRFQVSS
ncbi:MAG: nitronate monooxygenase [Candidatus Microthrix sp.]|nr:nitronate monooxygenase [Candidatus Microthrix sp.]